MVHRSTPRPRPRQPGVLAARAALILAALAALPALSHAQAPSAGYRNHAALTSSIDSLRRAFPRLVEVSTIATSPGGRAVQAIRLGAGTNQDSRPALLILANAYGPHVVGSEIAIGTLQRLARAYGSDQSVTQLLDRVTLYVIPRINPDAAEAFFARPLGERVLSEGAHDVDNDGTPNEDGPDDLNADGFLAMMRIADPAAEWRRDSTDPGLMRRADAAKGETGGWNLMAEGRDNDQDGQHGEDPAGGVDLNKNFAHDFSFFGDGGDHPFSAPEARGVAEFVSANANIAAAYVLGPQDNLMEPWRNRPQAGGPPQGTSAGGPYTSILRQDESYYVELSARFKKSTGLTRNPPTAALGGDPATWMYYHMGRLSFASRGWWIPDAPRDTAAGQPTAGGSAGQGVSGPDALASERNTLKWLQANDPSAVLPWSPIQHPDFPGQTVEVGGLRPFATVNPPAALLDSVVTKQARFIQDLAGLLPAIEFRDVKVETLGQGAYRISAQIANSGYLPTMSAIGGRARWVRQIRVDLRTGNGQTIVGGRGMQLVGAIAGSGRSTELSWVVTGAAGSTVTLTAASPAAGNATTTITLR